MVSPSDMKPSGVVRTGAPAGKGRRSPAATRPRTKEESLTMRQLNRKNDDRILCPMCLGSPWGPGRSSNCTDHIKRCTCISKLEQVYAVSTNGGAKTTACGGLWIHPDGTTTVATLSPGPGRKSHRTYWVPTTFTPARSHEARAKWMSMRPSKSATVVLTGDSAIRAIIGDKNQGLWEAKGNDDACCSMDHDGAVSRAVDDSFFNDVASVAAVDVDALLDGEGVVPVAAAAAAAVEPPMFEDFEDVIQLDTILQLEIFMSEINPPEVVVPDVNIVDDENFDCELAFDFPFGFGWR